MRILHIFSILAFGVFSASAVTISDIVNTIEQNNLSLKAEAANNTAAVAETRAENTLPATTIEYSPFFRSGVTGLASSELIVSQEFEFPTTYSSRNKVADSQQYALNMALAEMQRELRIEVMRECLSLVNAFHQRDILSERIAVTDTLLTLYRKKYELRSATQIDLNKIALSRQELQLAILENNIAIDEAQNRLITLNAGKPLDFTSLDYEVPISEIKLPSDLSQYALARPEVAKALADVQLASHEISVAKNEMLPSINLGYRRNTELDEASNGFLVGISVPLFSIGKKKKAAEARKAAALAEAEDTMMQTQSDVNATLRNLTSIRAAIEGCDTGLIRETLALYRRSLEAGRTTLTVYYTETDQLYERLQNQERLEYEYRNAAALLTE